MPPKISIVIPTHKREELLKFLLDSILEQTILTENFEVVVVDNYPSPYQPTHDLCASSRYALLDLKCVNDPILGSSEARNFGFRLAKAPWIGFIDDDEKLPAHWVERALETVVNYQPDIFGGPYNPYFVDPKPAWFKDRYLTLALNQGKGFVEYDRCLFGGNIVFERSWFERLGGYSTEYGRTGHNKEYGEETEIQLRAHRQGAKFFYDPDLYIFHYVHPERLTATWFLTSAWYHGKAKAKLTSAQEDRQPSPFRYSLSKFRRLATDSLMISGKYLQLSFRDRKAMPFRENYLVETIAPAISVFSMSWYLFFLSLGKKG